MSRRLGETGRVFLRVHVLPAGTPDQVEVRTGSGFPRLDNAAVDAVKRWRFVPAKQGSELVAAWVIVPISFSLEN
jgi:protein TonB